MEVGQGALRLGWLGQILQSMLCHVFQRFALEGDVNNRELIHKVTAVRLSLLARSFSLISLHPASLLLF